MSLGLAINLGLGSNQAAVSGGGGGTPLASTLTDNFNDNSLDATKWTTGQMFEPGAATTGVTVSEVNTRTEITPATSPSGATYSGRISLNNYNLTNDSFFAKFTNCASAQPNEVLGMSFGPDVNNLYRIVVDETHTLYLQKEVAAAKTTVGSIALGTAVWLRLRHQTSDNTIHVDTAPATASNPPIAGDWTATTLTEVKDAGINITSGKMCFVAGSFAAVTTPTVFQVDGFNTAT